MEVDFNAFAESLSASSEEDDDFSTAEESSDDSDGASSDTRQGQNTPQQICGARSTTDVTTSPKNLVLKLYNRERTGNFAGRTRRAHLPQRAYDHVPNRLRFCLKDIVPNCFLHGHIFMGLSACGQFLLSFKVCCNDNMIANNYSFSYAYKYTLYFWIYQPHKPLRSFFKTCLFDDHGVDNLKKVTMTQWKCSDPRILIVHGAAENENEDSYITYVKVPKLGCLDCKKLRDFEDSTFFRWHTLCLKCNLTIHTKYSSTESDPKFNSHVNLICPERILIVSNGFMHMMHIELIPPASTANSIPPQQQQHQQFASSRSTPCHESLVTRSSSMERRLLPGAADEQTSCDNHNNVIARIIADFSDVETDSTHSSETPVRASHSDASLTSPGSAVTFVSRKTYDEVIFTCSGSASPNAAATSTGAIAGNITKTAETKANIVPPVANNSPGGGGTARFSLINHRGRRHHRIVTKSFRNGVTTIDLQTTLPTSSSPASATMADRLNAYEFSEDNEKCEKISILRKRRLADKKYEFSEDNSENIVPFTKIRSATKNLALSPYTTSYASSSTRSLHRSATTTAATSSHHFYNSPCASPSSSPRPSHASPSNCSDTRHCTPPPMLRASPITSLQQGFRSPPCSSPVAGGHIRSPSRHVTPAHIYGAISPPQTISTATQQMLSFKPLGTLSPLQVSMAKRHLDLSGAISPNASAPFLSPRREENLNRVVEMPLLAGTVLEKPLCTKKFKRRFVEEDDAASVITSEEDDCISPGYHTSLPVEVHGSCYSEMQMVSQATYQKLNCPSVVITQHSFDLETFTYYTISALCQKNEKTYDVFYDWACELIRVCPLSQTIICLLMAQFSARDQLPTSPTNCLNCSRKLDCAFHRRQFECRILFTWNMDNGEWEVLDYGELHECKLSELISPIKRCGRIPVTLSQTAKKLASELSQSLSKIEQNYTCNLRVLDSNMKKSNLSVADHDNLIELYLKRPRSCGNSNAA